MKQLSHCTLSALCWCHATCYLHRNENLRVFFSSSILKTVIPVWPLMKPLLFQGLGCCWQTYSLSTCLCFCFLCFSVPRGHPNRSSIPHPSTSPLCWQAIDHPPPHCPSPTTSTDLSTLRQQADASLEGCVSSSWWFTVLLHKLTVDISQCLNTEEPYCSLMRRGSCRMDDADWVSVSW